MARVVELPSVAPVEPPSVARVVEALWLVRVEPPSAARVVEPLSAARALEPLSLAGAITEAFGMGPEGASGTAVGGPTV